jgi:4-amino-4-deoxy-L-arabinose transferase-like glycosyltransferase
VAEAQLVDRPAPVIAGRWSQRHFRPLLAAIVVGGLVLRVAYVWIYRRDTPYGGDPLYYHLSANLLATGHGFINPYAYARHSIVQAADHPPLYIMYLAVFSLFGVRSITGHLLASTLLGAGSVLVAGLAGREIGRRWAHGGERMGLLGALLVAVYPNTFRYDGMLLSETLVILTVLITVWLAYRYWHHPTRGRIAAVGAVVGLAALSRSELVLFVPLMVLPLALLTPDASRRRRLRRAVVGVAACVAVLTPWVAYNLSRFDHTVLLSENIGGTLATSNCHTVYYGRLMGYWDYQCGQDILTAHHIGPYAFNGAADRDQFNGGMKYIEAHKGRVPVVVVARIGRITDLFHPRQQAHLDVYLENTTSWVSFAGLYAFYPMALLAVAGAVVIRRRRTALFPLLAPVLSVVVTVALFYAATRFRATAEGAICLLAAAALDAALGALSRAREPDRSAAAGPPDAPGPALAGIDR